jgi:thiol-disulfide isomerase/thioredoxin
MKSILTITTALFAIAGATSAYAEYSGKLLDQAGKPVSGASITWLSRVGGIPKDEHTVKSGPDGAFTIPELGTDAAALQQLFIETPDGVDFARLEPEIHLHPRGDLSVQLVDAQKRPVPHVKVRTTVLIEGPRKFYFLPKRISRELSAESDESGLCIIKNVPLGWKIRFDTDDLRFVSLNSLARDFVVGEQQAPVQLDPAGAVQGRLLAADGKPVAKTRIFISGNKMGSFGEGVTDEAGRYKIGQLKGEDGYQVSVDLTALQKEWTAKACPGVYVKVGQTVSVPDIHLEKGRLLSGKVFLVESKKPLPKIAIGIVGPANLTGYGAQIVTADEGGSYQVRVPEGQQLLYIQSLPGGSPINSSTFSEHVTVSKADVTVNFAIPDAMMKPVPMAADVLVVDEKDQPVEGAHVFEMTGHPVAGGEEGYFTDAKGHLKIDGPVEPQEYFLASKGTMGTTLPGRPDSTGAVKVVLRDHVASIVNGTLHSDQGAPLAGATVYLVLWGSEVGYSIAHTEADASGRYRFESVIPNQKYCVRCTAPGFAENYSENKVVGSGETTTLDVSLVTADSFIAGKLVDSAGKGLPGFTVQVINQFPGVVTDLDGHFRIDGVGRGDVTVQASTPFGFVSESVKSGQSDLILKVAPEPTETKAPGEQPAEHFADMAGQQAPELQASSWLNATSPLSLRSLKGKIVVIDFWGTWCAPCVASLPEVESLHKRYADKGVVVIGFHECQGDPKVVLKFAQDHGMTYSIGIDKKSASVPGFGPTFSKYTILGIPTVAVIDRSGQIVLMTHEISEAANLVARMTSSH